MGKKNTMINEIIAKNFIMFKDIDIRFKNGLNVITGETGAGKSLIVKLIDILSGNKATTESIRFGEEESIVQGIFGKNEEIIVTRIISSKSRNNIKLNGLRITLKELQENLKNSIYVHSQNKQYQLLNPKYIYKIISAYDKNIKKIEGKYKESYQNFKSMEKRLSEFNIDPQEINRKLDILNYQINEIESANLKEDEENELKREYSILSNFEKIDLSLNKANSYITEDDWNIVDKLNELSKDFESVGNIDKKLNEFSKRLNNIVIDLQDLLDDMNKYLTEIEYDKEKLNFIEERLNSIYSLKNKYGNNVREIMEYLEKIKKEHTELSGIEEKKERLKKEILEEHEKAVKIAEELSRKRKLSAEQLSKKINEILPDFGMQGAKIKFEFEKSKELGQNGIDEIKLKIRTNIGEPYKYYNNILSGGELSRLMLSFELSIKDTLLADTLVFDEIDTGIGGETAIKLGKKLKELSSRGYQIILVTHLPQIAAFSDHHIKIEKIVKNSRTYSIAKNLNKNEREKEIERMRKIERKSK